MNKELACYFINFCKEIGYYYKFEEIIKEFLDTTLEVYVDWYPGLHEYLIVNMRFMYLLMERCLDFEITPKEFKNIDKKWRKRFKSLDGYD